MHTMRLSDKDVASTEPDQSEKRKVPRRGAERLLFLFGYFIL